MRSAFRSTRVVMEFAVAKTVGKRRLGKLTSKRKNGETWSIKTPACLLYAKSGCVPHLTHDTLRLSMYRDKEAEKDGFPLPILFPMAAFLPHRKCLESYSSQTPDRGIVDFVGLSSDFHVISFLTQNDPTETLPSGYNAGKSISLWNYAGKAEVTPEIAAKMASLMASDVAQILADSDVGFHQRENEEGATSKKRQTKAIQRSCAFATRVCRQLEEDAPKEKERRTSFWATATVGFEQSQSKRYHKELSDVLKDIDGYVIDGIQPASNLRSIVESPTHVQRVISAFSGVVDALPESKPRLVSHVATPMMVVESVESGIDLFDTSFAIVAADRGGALVFHIGADESADDIRPVVEIDLNDAVFAEDFAPLLIGCPCYSCSNHTRAYLHHLLVTQELLAHVLLAIHNQYHYTKFFSRMRDAIETDEWDAFKKRILSHDHSVPAEEEKIDAKRCGDEFKDDGKRKKKLVL